MSIRLGSDGHSFSVVGAETLRGGAAGVAGTAWVEVEVLTPLTLLVPAALCDGRNGAALLAAAGLPPRAGDAVVRSAPAGDGQAVALMALPEAALRMLGERLGLSPGAVAALREPEESLPAIGEDVVLQAGAGVGAYAAAGDAWITAADAAVRELKACAALWGAPGEASHDADEGGAPAAGVCFCGAGEDPVPQDGATVAAAGVTSVSQDAAAVMAAADAASLPQSGAADPARQNASSGSADGLDALHPHGGAAAVPAVRFTSPLLHPVAEAGRCVWLRPEAGILYIKVYDGGLRLAEAIPSPTVDDALCLLDRLAGVWPLAEFTLRLAGAQGAAWRKTFKRRFRQIVCES
ncbi:hypothetical protein [uncultured Alistipes sp.]|uniref:hypothetical protein n=1 Tax=uncultured Alistipes sp. TaxID=538949 RepID=UPI00262934A9|nr:hypothetical protein [uncultured Alistipes sp.]